MQLVNSILTNVQEYLGDDEVSIVFKFIDGKHLAVTVQSGPIVNEEDEELHKILVQAMLNVTTLSVDEILNHAEAFNTQFGSGSLETIPVAGHA